MTPVVSPWWFYLISVVDRLGILSVIALICVVVVLIVFVFLYLTEMDYYPDEDKVTRYKKYIKVSAIGTIVFGAMTCAIPSSNTLTKMLIAQNVTYERVEVATDTVETVYNDIMALFEDKGETK